ncbi:MAG: putative transcriptional regulator [Firmicutes bacterium]|nr:putative transcriptional regulator [Bacillota bacterium]
MKYRKVMVDGMRTLKHAILGVINREAMTGYDLMKVFNLELVNFWYAKHSQIYPELKKLTDEGLITYETVLQGEKLEKKLYSITEAGKEAFLRWLSKQDLLEPTPKDIFRLKVYFIESMTKEDILKQFHYQLDLRKEKLEKLETTMIEHPYARIISDVISPLYGDYIVLKGAIMRERTYIDWLLECIKEIENC